VLFLVDRRALAAQAVRAFNSFDVEPNLKFTKAYEVYSSRFQKEDFRDEDRFDPKLLPQGYLTDPQPGHAFVYVATIQRMAVNILDIPIHAFDLVVADECHRGYTSQELSVWRDTLDHFDAVKIGLTATPATHTAAYFKHLAFTYRYDQAVSVGHLVDYDVVNVRSEVRMTGVFLKEGDRVEQVDAQTGLSRMDTLEDERAFDAAEIERRITAPHPPR
jgi:type I restriction enzyme R subunit